MEMQKSAAQSGKWVLGLPHLFLVSLSQITPVSTGAQGNIGGIYSSRTVTCNVSTPPESYNIHQAFSTFTPKPRQLDRSVAKSNGKQFSRFVIRN